jgi:DnaA-homolog protein
MNATSTMQQVPLPLVGELPGRFDTYLPGPNALAVTQLAQDLPPRAPVYLWGDAGSGKTHLLQAVAQALAERGLASALFGPELPTPWVLDDSSALLLLDDVQRLTPEQQHQAFALCVEAQARGIAWVAAGTVPPVDLPLRDDLRSRLGWGQIHALKPLDEEETVAALGLEAERRGILLSPEVLRYLFSRYSRDLSSLMRLLQRLDAYSLAHGRAVTLPLLRKMWADGEAAANPLAAPTRAQDQPA